MIGRGPIPTIRGKNHVLRLRGRREIMAGEAPQRSKRSDANLCILVSAGRTTGWWSVTDHSRGKILWTIVRNGVAVTQWDATQEVPLAAPRLGRIHHVRVVTASNRDCGEDSAEYVEYARMAVDGKALPRCLVSNIITFVFC